MNRRAAKRLLLLLVAAALMAALVSCGGTQTLEDPDAAIGGQDTDDGTKANAETADAADDGTGTQGTDDGDAEGEPLNVAFMKGPTGIGASYLMERNANGETATQYNITVEADVQNVNAALIQGELDIAAVPTNVAALLYNKTGGEVQIVAINTLGVLYILEKGDSIEEIGDLAGKTIYATGQGSNPQFVLEYILEESGLAVGDTVNVEYLPSDELATKMAAGQLDVCMLPVPNATSVLMKNEEVRAALNVADVWEDVTGGDSVLTQGCIVARKSVTDEELREFLEEYRASIDYMKDENNLDSAAELAVKYEIVAAEPVAKRALPDCNLTYMDGRDEMKQSLNGYFEILFAANPESVGGSVPDDTFYREIPAA